MFEGGSWGVAFKEFRAVKGKRGSFEALRQSKDPTMLMVLFEDTAVLIGVTIALAGIAASQALGRPEPAGAASIGIGLLLGLVAMFLARVSKGLLTDQVVAAITMDFRDTLSAADVEASVVAIEDRVKVVHLEVVLLIKPQSAAALERARSRRPATP